MKQSRQRPDCPAAAGSGPAIRALGEYHVFEINRECGRSSAIASTSLIPLATTAEARDGHRGGHFERHGSVKGGWDGPGDTPGATMRAIGDAIATGAATSPWAPSRPFWDLPSQLRLPAPTMTPITMSATEIKALIARVFAGRGWSGHLAPPAFLRAAPKAFAESQTLRADTPTFRLSL